MNPQPLSDKAQLQQKPSLLSRRTIAALVLAGILFLTAFLFPYQEGPDNWFWQHVADFLHAPLFALPPLVLMPFLRRHLQWPWHRAAGTSLAFCAALALGIETIQPLTHRHFSWGDILIGLAGSLFAISFLLFNSPKPSKPQKATALAGTTLAAVVLVTFAEPINHGYKALQWRAQNFPLLADFQNPAQQHLWVPGPDHQPATLNFQNNHVHISPSTADFSGAKLRAGGKDWSAYTHLTIQLHNPQPGPLHLGIKIEDTTISTSIQGRYQAPLTLNPGSNTVSIPLADVAGPPDSQKTNLSAVTLFSIFTDPDNPGPDPSAGWSLQHLSLNSRSNSHSNTHTQHAAQNNPPNPDHG
jgi:hypothetical protein